MSFLISYYNIVNIIALQFTLLDFELPFWILDEFKLGLLAVVPDFELFAIRMLSYKSH